MELNSIAALYGGYVDSLLNNSVQAGVLQSSSTNGSTGFSTSSQGSDSSQLSPLAHIFSTLQQLQETNPTRYQQVTEKIAVNLQTAAQTAQSGGNTSAADQLNQLATDFNDASNSGELPNIQDMANLMGYHQGPSSADTDNAWSTGATSAPSVISDLSLNPLAIILNTLSRSSGKQ